jgi:hypothetical protein
MARLRHSDRLGPCPFPKEDQKWTDHVKTTRMTEAVIRPQPGTAKCSGDWASRCCVRAAILIRSVILTQSDDHCGDEPLPSQSW